MRSAWVVGDSRCEFIPNDTITIQCSVAVAVYCEPITTEDPGGRLVLITSC